MKAFPPHQDEIAEKSSSVELSVAHAPIAKRTTTAASKSPFGNPYRKATTRLEYVLYLECFPNGQFAELAAARLEKGGPGEHDPGVEITFWETVRDTGNPEMIEAYLAKYPQGQFSDLANIMLGELRGNLTGESAPSIN